MAAEKGVTEQEWKSGSPDYGWNLRLKIEGRIVIYLAPCAGCFRVAFVLGDHALAAARQSDLPLAVIKAINEAPRFWEGTGVRLMVKGEEDVPGIQKLAAIKLAN
jgi:hypothetical protein